jgi:hypothetical protein
MTEAWFSKPVRIAIGVFGDERNVSSARQALQVLDSRWPDAGAPKYREARHFCQRAVNGDDNAEHARDCFVEAARQARVLVE